jgi:hypothetical protein
LEELANRNPDVFSEVIKYYLVQGDYLEIAPWIIVSNLLPALGAARAFFILNTPEYPSKNRWLFSYYQHLPSNDIQPEHINALYKLYKESEYKFFIYDVDYLLKYESSRKGFVADIVLIIIERASVSQKFAHSLSPMFSPHTKINKTLRSVFSGKLYLLEDAYIAIDRVEQHADYDGTTLSTILDNDHAFIDKYLEDKFTRKKYLSRRDDRRDYSFIWLRNDYINIMRRVTPFVFEKERNNRFFRYYESFYNKGANPQTNRSILKKQNNYLCKEIEFKSDQSDYMHFLFSVIVNFSLQRQLIFYETFLNENKEFNDFINIFAPTPSRLTSSAIPMLQKKIDFYEEIIKICKLVDLLDHRLVDLLDHREFIEQRIKEIRNKIQYKKKRDFTEAQ